MRVIPPADRPASALGSSRGLPAFRGVMNSRAGQVIRQVVRLTGRVVRRVLTTAIPAAEADLVDRRVVNCSVLCE